MCPELVEGHMLIVTEAPRALVLLGSRVHPGPRKPAPIRRNLAEAVHLDEQTAGAIELEQRLGLIGVDLQAHADGVLVVVDRDHRSGLA
jgi:hypothetical protein